VFFFPKKEKGKTAADSNSSVNLLYTTKKHKTPVPPRHLAPEGARCHHQQTPIQTDARQVADTRARVIYSSSSPATDDLRLTTDCDCDCDCRQRRQRPEEESPSFDDEPEKEDGARRFNFAPPQLGDLLGVAVKVEFESKF
jgi:hypothetical protein